MSANPTEHKLAQAHFLWHVLMGDLMACLGYLVGNTNSLPLFIIDGFIAVAGWL